MPQEAPQEAYVWVWLPAAVEPVVAGRMFREGERLLFNYGQEYLQRPDAISLHAPELPLAPGVIAPGEDLSMAGCLRDSAPDAWGRRVILNKLLGVKGREADTDALDELTYLLHSGSDRSGALDFQASPSLYEPRMQTAPLEVLLQAAEKVEQGIPLIEEVEKALFHGTSLGGARPKAMLQDGDKKYIAKFSSSGDIYNVVKAEFVAMRLAAEVGLSVAPVRLQRVAGRDVLLVERFDRVSAGDGWRRRGMVSALTLFGFAALMARYASYAELADIIRHRFAAPKDTLRELFGRLVFNILCGNTDDHARNHAAFWDGELLTLTPAYDICPQNRAGNEASQAMWVTEDDRMSRLAVCLKAAPNFLLETAAARALIAEQMEKICAAWPQTIEEAELSETDRRLLAERMFFNPFVFEEAPPQLADKRDALRD